MLQSQIIDSEMAMLDYVGTLNYLVVFPDQSKHFFKSLRQIGQAIAIDFTTISKKLNDADSCICVARGSDFIFWVRRL